MKKYVHNVPPENFSPTVEVAVCFCETNNKILLLQRNDNKILGGTWVIPGGKIDLGETAKNTVLREILEETGISLQEKQILFIKKLYVRGYKIETLPGSIDIDFILHIFKAKLPEVPQKIILNKEEHQNSKWLTPEETLKINLLPGQDEYIRSVYLEKDNHSIK